MFSSEFFIELALRSLKIAKNNIFPIAKRGKCGYNVFHNRILRRVTAMGLNVRLQRRSAISRRIWTVALKNSYLCDLMKKVEQRNPGDTQFQITVRSVLESIEPVVEARPELIEKGVLEMFVEP